MRKEPDNPKLLAVCWLIGCAFVAASGCQRRAYTDLYAESMAGEIRELEDRIYEYDAAYQGIEGELAAMQSENARLQKQLAAAKSAASGANGTPSNGRGLFKNLPGSRKPADSNESFHLQESYPSDSEPSFQIIPNPDPVPSIVPAVPPNAASETITPSGNSLSAPADNKPKPSTPKPSSPSTKKDTDVPKVDLGTPSSSSMPPSSLFTPNSNPSQPSNSIIPGNTPSTPFSPPNPGNTPAPSIPNFPPAGGSEDLLPPLPKLSAPPTTSIPSRASSDRSVQAASSVVPVVDPSDSRPQPMPADTAAIQSLPTAIDDDEVNAGRIALPSSIQAAVATPESSSKSSLPRDTKIVEVAFHPTLCRGQYLDSSDNGDGLHLVLQPRNASGETLDTPAALTVVVLDPNRPEEQSKLGRWTLSKEEVDAQLEPIGISRGFHIALKWQDAKPLGDSVQVYIRYEMEDGRRLVNERRLQIHVPSIGSASWTPRVAK